MKRTLKRELKVLEIVGGEAIGGCDAAGLEAAPPGCAMRRHAGQHGFGARDKPLLCRRSMPRAGSRNSGRSDFDLRPQGAGTRPPMGPS